MYKINFKKPIHVHFIGIGGISMSGLAEIMLKSGTDGISDVAWKCGFDDESYFYRCYKRQKGTPPGKVGRGGARKCRV